MVHQHFHLVDRHSVLENLMVGEPGRRGLIDRAGARARLAGIGARYGLRLDPDRPAGALSVGERQRLEIIKALYRGARVLILDEPTSVLTPQETEGLFAAIRAMAAEGVGVIFISHKLNEVRAITDRLVVMRQGAVVAETANDGTVTARRLALLMCGHELAAPAREAARPGPVLLALDAVSTRRGPEHPVALKGVSLGVQGGEILGIVGVSGNGQGELAELIGGTLKAARGRIEVAGRTVTGAGARKMRLSGRRACARGPPRRRALEHAAAHRQHDPGPGRRGALQPARDPEPWRGQTLRRRPDREVRDPRPRARGAHRHALGRQPAKGAARPGARVRAAGPGRRPADPGPRRRAPESSSIASCSGSGRAAGRSS